MRAQELERKTASLRSNKKIKVVFEPSGETEHLRYFPEDIWADLAQHGDDRYEFDPEGDLSETDLLIVTGHGSDLSGPLWDLRRQGFDAIIAVWLWDNHGAKTDNLRTALAADFVYPSHQYVADYLCNPVSVLGPHLPACSAQWSIGQAGTVFENNHPARGNKLYAHYVDYEWSSRSPVLHRLASEMPEADMLLMNPKDRTPYFGKDRLTRMTEWMSYKTSLVLPVDRDLSTRLFDGLLCGHTLVVATDVADLDSVIPRSRQRELGIVRSLSCDTEDIQRAHREALAIFDKVNEDGARRRHRFVLENHMLVHRIVAIVETILNLVRGDLKISFTNLGNAAPGLLLGPSSN